MDETTKPAVEIPDVFLIACSKCTRTYEIHGRESLLTACLEAEGWYSDEGKNICPKCQAPRPRPVYNTSRSDAKRARRAA